MKKCPFCDGDIKDEAKKCRYCGEFLEKTNLKEKEANININNTNNLVFYKIEVFSFILCYILISLWVKANSAIIFGEVIGYIIIYFFLISIIYELFFRLLTKKYYKFNIIFGIILYSILSLILLVFSRENISYDNNSEFNNNVKHEKYVPENYHNTSNVIKDNNLNNNADLTIITDTINKFSEQKKFKQELKDNEHLFNEGLPYNISKDVRFDKISIGGNTDSISIMEYNYTYLNALKHEIDIKTTSSAIKFESIKSIKSNNDLKEYRENKVNFLYKYYDKNGEYIFEIKIGPLDYNNTNINNYSIDFSDI